MAIAASNYADARLAVAKNPAVVTAAIKVAKRRFNMLSAAVDQAQRNARTSALADAMAAEVQARIDAIAAAKAAAKAVAEGAAGEA